MSEGTVIFERESDWMGRYRVETKTVEGYWESSWVLDRTYETPESAISRAENLLYKRGIDYVRVVDTEDGE